MVLGKQSAVIIICNTYYPALAGTAPRENLKDITIWIIRPKRKLLKGYIINANILPGSYIYPFW